MILLEKLLRVASESGQFSGEELEGIYGLTERKDQLAQVPGLEAEPPMYHEETFTFGLGDRKKTVPLRAVGLDLILELLPYLQEWCVGLFGLEEAADLLQKASGNPADFIVWVIERLSQRPRTDRLYVSLLEAMELTFSHPDTPITMAFLHRCPAGQLPAAVRRLAEANRENFGEGWGGLPYSAQLQLTLLYTTILKLIESANLKLMAFTSLTMQETQNSLLLSGGALNTGTDGSPG